MEGITWIISIETNKYRNLCHHYLTENGTATNVLSQIKINSSPSPTFSIEIVNCSKTLSSVTTGTSTTKTSVVVSRCASWLKSTPHQGVEELNTTCQASLLGTVHKLYLPALSSLSPKRKSLVVS